MSNAVALLSAPALLALGIASSPHCALMCAPLAHIGNHHRARSALQLHAGRLTAYAILGALAGGFGAALLWQAQRLGLLPLVRWIAAAGLIGFALWHCWQLRPLPPCCARPAAAPTLPPYWRGLLWGLLPCGLLYGVLGLALLSGNAATGALLSLAFGLGTTPLLLATGALATGLFARVPPARRRAVGAGLLLLSGLWILAWTPHTNWISEFCRVAL